MPLASAAASPPDEPPGVRVGSHGLRVRPATPLTVSQRKAKSGKFVRASGMAPASRRRATIGASVEAICLARAATPQVVAEPATSMFSLMVNGTPASGPSDAPAATARSTAAAAARASSASVTVTALMAGLTSSMRAR
jgi:hypothetical protein